MINSEEYKQIAAEIKRYITLQVDYSKLTVLEKMVVLLSTAAIAIIIGALAICVLFYLSLSLESYLTQVLGCQWGSYLIVATLYLLIMAVVIALKDQLIVNPIAKFLSKLFLTPKK